MDKDIVLEASGLSKRYRLGRRANSDTLIGGLSNAMLNPLRNLRELRRRRRFGEHPTDQDDPSVLWALRNVNFSVRRGEVLGIIGHNGAGKSTLLKVLSRITEPTHGHVRLRGRVASLLEVGTGFHAELTGRDNVYMNGTILGLTHRQVRERFDEIVAFSGVAAHIDTPVKFYSSGMKVRLAFAVAAHLDPDILIIDEVLAVGDLSFQQKCLGKMDAVSRSGRTVLFVSHNMGTVEGLCSRCLVMDGGRVSYDGTVDAAIERYRLANQYLHDNRLEERTDRDGDGHFRFTDLRINEGRPVLSGQPTSFELDYTCTAPIQDLRAAIKIGRAARQPLLTIDTKSQGVRLNVQPGRGTLRIQIPRLDLLPHRYVIDLWAANSLAQEDRIFDVTVLQVEEHDLYGTGNSLTGKQHGVLVPPPSQWTQLSPSSLPQPLSSHGQ